MILGCVKLTVKKLSWEKRLTLPLGISLLRTGDRMGALTEEREIVVRQSQGPESAAV